MIVKINVHLNLNVTQCIIVLKPYIININPQMYDFMY